MATVVQIGTTNRCNEVCTFCPNPTMSRSKGHMTMETFRKIIEDDAAPVYCLCAFGEGIETVGGAVRGNDLGVMGDAKGGQGVGGMPHRLPVRLAAHDDRDGG